MIKFKIQQKMQDLDEQLIDTKIRQIEKSDRFFKSQGFQIVYTKTATPVPYREKIKQPILPYIMKSKPNVVKTPS